MCSETSKTIVRTSDAGDYWNVTIQDHYIKEVRMKTAVSDPSLYFRSNRNTILIGILGNYVDDSLIGGDDEFENLCNHTLRRLESRTPEQAPTVVAGIKVQQENGVASLLQLAHISKLTNLPVECSFAKFRSTLAHQP